MERYGLAVGAGLLWAASFPRLEVAGLAWVVPALVLASAMGVSGGQTFRLGYAAGLVHYLSSLYWLLWIPVKVAPIAGWLALAAYLALHPALWTWLCWKLCPVPLEAGAEPGEWAGVIERFAGSSWGQRLWWSVTCAALWVAWEMVQARLWTGFPWNLLGVSQREMLPLIQMASVTGVYGVSFLVAWFSVSLLCAGLMLWRAPLLRWGWMRELALPLLVVAALAGLGARRLLMPEPGGPELRVALVQPSIPQTMIWDDREAAQRFRQLLQLSEQALTNRPDLMVWPEAGVPGLFRWDAEVRDPVLALVRSNQLWLVLGADDVSWRGGPQDQQSSYDSYNSSFLVNPAGEIAATYRKRRLVIFGEYVPLVRWLPIVKRLTPISGGFEAGDRVVRFALTDLGVQTAVLICFEDVFPHLAREYADAETDFLLNLTNNGWFGESAAQWQHAANAVFRAVENGLPLVRCTNNGLTCWVDRRGRMRDVYFSGSRNVYGPGYKLVHIPILAKGSRETTFYRRHGDWFGWSCVGWVCLAGLGRWRAVKRLKLSFPGFTWGCIR